MTFPKVAVLVATVLLASHSMAADQTILGKNLVVKNPKADKPEKRSIVAFGKENASPNTIVGDPTAVGATLTVIANGVNASSQAFLLPQGINTKGKPFWGASKNGFKYKDAKGEQGAVKIVVIQRTDSGNFLLKALVLGKQGPVDVVPPNAGTSGFATLDIVGGDRYCVQFGPGGVVKNKGDQLFKITNPSTEGCPSGGSPSGAFLLPPGD